MNYPLISIIVPVYKVEQYLDRCVESIVNQTYENLEIILVDDGSPDKCPEMCDKWAKKDERIKVVHSSNCGVSCARNKGFESSVGDYIAFVDSDDWIAENYIQTLYETLIFYDCDIVECDYVTTNGESYNKQDVTPKAVIYSPQDALRCNLQGCCFGDVIWNRLYRRDVADVKFEIGKYHEDVYWVYQVLSKANKLVRLNQPLYFYFQRKDGFTGEQYTFKRIDAVRAGNQRSNFIIDNYPELASLAQTQFVGMCMYHSQKLLSSKIEGYKGYFCDLHAYAKKIHVKQKCKRDISQKQKMWLILYLNFPHLTCKIRNSLKIGL